MANRESQKHFIARVRELTGQSIVGMPRRPVQAFEGHIICRRGNLAVVGVGHPDVDPDTNEESWDRFEVQVLEPLSRYWRR